MRPTTTASNLFRRALCPGSARLEAGLPDEDSEQSREGILLHDYSAHPEYDRAMLKSNQRDLLSSADELTKTVIDRVERENDLAGKPVEDFKEWFLNATTISGTPDFVRYYHATENNGVDGGIAQFKGLGKIMSDEEVARDELVRLIGVSSSHVLVIDRKFGYNIVERADLNLQLRTYAVLTWLEPVKTSFVAIVQPRLPFEERVTIAKYTPEDIEASRLQIKAILGASAEPDAPLVPGEEQCRYCKAKLICPAFREAIQRAPALMSVDDALTKTAREAYLVERLAQCTDEQLEKMLDAIRLAAFAHDPALDEARKRIAAGAFTNFKLAKSSEVRNVSDVRRALALLNLAGLPKDRIYDCITNLSLTKLGEVVRKVHPTWDWKQTNEWINTKLKTVIETETRKQRVLKK